MSVLPHDPTLPPSATRYPFPSTATAWPEIDLGILEEKRGLVPLFPLDLLPEPWRDWSGNTASSTGAPTDYVVQSVLAALAGLCGAGARVRITPTWSEPLVLWQAAVGETSSGKSRALATMRGLLGVIEEERRAHDDERRERHAERAAKAGIAKLFVPSQVVSADSDVDVLAGIVRGNPRGVILWRDELSSWLGESADADRACWLQAWAAAGVTLDRPRSKAALRLQSFPVGILGTLQSDRLKEALQEGDDGLAARFLYAWPGAQPYRPLADCRIARDDEALTMLRRVDRLARTPDDPLVLPFDVHGIKAFDEFLAGLHADRGKSEGLEAAWLGKGPATIVRLAAALELLAWSASGAKGPPGHIGRDQVEAATALWSGYFRPHARAVFDRAVPTDFDRRVRRVARWLKDSGATVVSREDIRSQALSRTVNAEGVQQILYRLDSLGFVRADRTDDRAGPGRPASRWLVNPALADA